jgi:hypothetical protein
MTATFDIPPQGEKIQALVDERLHQAMLENGAKVTVEWRGEQKHLHVISMPTAMLYFNPDTHRIRAQRSLDSERNRILSEHPWSEEGQDYLRYLLTRSPGNPDQTDPDYTALTEELKVFGQKEPGIISPLGILVDGNTRCAALRDLGYPDIRVGVLPSDTSRRDINSVELALQLRRDKRREYSYINRLIAIDEQITSGRREEDVAREFNIKAPTLKKDLWVYGLIKKAISRSEADGAPGLRLVDFEEHQEKLREIYTEWAKLAESNPEKAEQLVESRLAMVVLGYAKTSVRFAEPDFYPRYLEQRLSNDLRPESSGSTAVEIPGLPQVTVPGKSATVKTVAALTDTLLKATAVVNARKDLSPEEKAAAQQTLDAAKKTFDQAVKLAGQDYTLKKRQTALADRLTDAADLIRQCADEFADARAKHALDEDAFDDALLLIRANLQVLAKRARRAFETPGDGVSWLLEAGREA